MELMRTQVLESRCDDEVGFAESDDDCAGLTF
jgi:hypothetical protein